MLNLPFYMGCGSVQFTLWVTPLIETLDLRRVERKGQVKACLDLDELHSIVGQQN